MRRRDFVTAVPTIIFFVAGFNFATLSANLLLRDDLLPMGSLVVATTGGLLVGLAVLAAEKRLFFGRFRSAPLIVPALCKSGIYTMVILAGRLGESYVHYMLNQGRLVGFSFYLYEQFRSVGTPEAHHLPGWRAFVLIQVWTFILLLLYATWTELDRFFGYRVLGNLFFTRARSHPQAERPWADQR